MLAAPNAGLDPGARGDPPTLARAVTATFAFVIPLDVLPAGSVGSAARIVGAAYAAAAIWHILRVRLVRRVGAPIVLVALFTAWVAISSTWAANGHSAEVVTPVYAQLFVFVFLGWQITRTWRDWRALASGFVVGCSVAAVGSWIASWSGAIYVDNPWEDTRAAAFGMDPNEMGVTLALGIPTAIYLAVCTRSLWRYVLLAYIPLALSAIVNTGSRGGAITTGAALAGGVVLAVRADRRLVLPLAAVVTAGMIAAAAYVPVQTWQRIGTTSQQLSGGTIGNRIQIWRAGFRVFTDHPIAGVGVGQFKDSVAPLLTRGMVAHNTPLSIATEFGIIGFVLFFGAFAAAALASLRRASSRVIVPTILVTWFIGASSLTWEYRKTTWLMLLLTATASALQAPRREDPA